MAVLARDGCGFAKTPADDAPAGEFVGESPARDSRANPGKSRFRLRRCADFRRIRRLGRAQVRGDSLHDFNA
jgi:hypothetical protein